MILVRQLTDCICVSGCSGLNFQDLMVRQGAIDSPPKTPFILGFECAGEVEDIGEGVTDFKVSHSRVVFFALNPANLSRSPTAGLVILQNFHKENCMQ
jgi:NADPH:quinone reductase-like Zn-dependent oxidoreductase